MTIAVCALDMWLSHVVELRREPGAARACPLLSSAAALDAGLDSVRTTIRMLGISYIPQGYLISNGKIVHVQVTAGDKTM